MIEIFKQYPTLTVAVSAFGLVGTTVAMLILVSAQIMRAWTEMRKFYAEIRREKP